MTADVHTLAPGDSLRDAADLFTAEHISGAPVVQGGQPVGVLSTTDVLDVQAATPGSPTSRPEQASWDEMEGPDAYEWSGDRPTAVYFTRLWDDAGADVRERFRKTDRPEWDVLDEQTVDEAMSRSIFSLPPDATAEEAAGFMLENEVHRVLVVEEDELVGVVTTTDLMRAVGQHGLGG